MILSNYEEFMSFIPTTFDANQDLDLFREWIDIADYMTGQNLLGQSLYDHVCSLPDKDNFRLQCKRYVSHLALFEAIPNLDLILTGNGFAVVGGSNSQFVPASKDRVAALRLQEDVWREMFHENIINRIIICDEFREKWDPVNFHKALYIGLSDFRTFVSADNLRDPENYHKAESRVFKVVDEYVTSFISEDYYRELINKQYSATLSTSDYDILFAAKSAIGLLISNAVPSDNDYKAAKHLMLSALNKMMNNLSEYVTFAGSDQYKYLTKPIYENKPEHPSYFGGI